jgi:hypothetical protein
MSMWRRPYKRSLLPIELERPEKKAMVVEKLAVPVAARRWAGRATTAGLRAAPWVMRCQ